MLYHLVGHKILNKTLYSFKRYYCQILRYFNLVRGRLYIFTKKVSFDFAIALCSIGVPDIPKNFAQRSEMENMVF